MKRSEDELLRFIAASFPSVWALELLLALKQEPLPQSREELVTALRASELVISKALEALLSGGLVSVEEGGVVYMPASAAAAATLDAVERLYRSRPDKVRRAIVSAAAGGATAFAEAFKLRKD